MKLSDVLFLSVQQVERGHAEGLAVGGGLPGIRDPGLLESAVMAPRSGYYDSLAELAAVLAFGIAKNHAFLDGNKRTAFYALVTFLEVNDVVVVLGFDKWLPVFEDLAEIAGRGALEEAGLVLTLARITEFHVAPMATDDYWKKIAGWQESDTALFRSLSETAEADADLLRSIEQGAKTLPLRAMRSKKMATSWMALHEREFSDDAVRLWLDLQPLR